MHVFAYGTLMFPEVWQAVVGRTFKTVGGQAHGYTIYRVRDAVYPGITSAAASVVPGIVYFDVDDESVARLDRFEDDFYQRITICVACEDGEQRMADAYVVLAEHRKVLTDEIWSGADFVARNDLARFVAGFVGFQRVSS